MQRTAGGLHSPINLRCLGCDTHQTVALDIVRRPEATPIHELERYMRCKDCSQVRGYAYKCSHRGLPRCPRFLLKRPTAEQPFN